MQKFKRFAVNVWGVDPAGKSDEEVARAGLEEMEKWMKELSLVMNITELGASESMIEGLTNSTLIMDGGYKKLTKEEIADIFRASL